MKTILITGATGFVGYHIIERAIEKGYNLIASVRNSSDITHLKKYNIPTVVLSLSDPTKLKSELLNLRNTYGCVDFIVHNAGITQSLNNDDYYRVNYTLTKNLIDSLIKIEMVPQKFILTSSIAALGPGNQLSLLPIKEDAKPHPVTHYGKSKLMAEEYLRTQNTLPWIILRPTIVYGPREKNFFKMIKAIDNGLEVYVGSKKQMLSFIYVSDLVNSMLEICDNKVKNESFNLCDGKSYSIKIVNRAIKKVLSKQTISLVLPVFFVRIIAYIVGLISSFSRKAPILNLDKVNEIVQLNWLCDNSKIINETGFIPTHDFDLGIIKTINWYKTNGWLS